MPSQIASLEETDPIRAKTSKKDAESRVEEVRKFASEALIEWIAKSGEAVLREPRGSLVVTEIMLYADGGMFASFLFFPSHSLSSTVYRKLTTTIIV